MADANKVLIGVIVVMAVIICTQLIIIMGFWRTHDEQETNFHTYQEGASVRFQRMQEDLQNLNDKNYLLLNDLNSTQAQYEDAYSQLQAERKEVENTLRVIDQYHAEIQKRMAWFKDNAQLTITPFPTSDPRNAGNMKHELASNCLKRSGNVCSIDMGCIADLNRERFGIAYRSDEERRAAERWDVADKLHSISEMLAQGGGDCDDYSIFVKAEVNSLKQECGPLRQSIVGWSRGPGKYDMNYSEAAPARQEGAAQHPLAEAYTYPNMVCGTFDGGRSGHCMLAFTAAPVRTADDVSYLNYAELIEPQTGEAKGRINDNYNVKMGEQIWVVASDTNLFFYSAKQDRWFDDTGFDRELLEAEAKLAPSR